MQWRSITIAKTMIRQKEFKIKAAVLQALENKVHEGKRILYSGKKLI